MKFYKKQFFLKCLQHKQVIFIVVLNFDVVVIQKEAFQTYYQSSKQSYIDLLLIHY
ncbi:hypothetical protein pb186bvf_016432 [Paramecium bursaria]